MRLRSSNHPISQDGADIAPAQRPKLFPANKPPSRRRAPSFNTMNPLSPFQSTETILAELEKEDRKLNTMVASKSKGKSAPAEDLKVKRGRKIAPARQSEAKVKKRRTKEGKSVLARHGENSKVKKSRTKEQPKGATIKGATRSASEKKRLGKALSATGLPAGEVAGLDLDENSDDEMEFTRLDFSSQTLPFRGRRISRRCKLIPQF
jgi:hypothetical protein